MHTSTESKRKNKRKSAGWAAQPFSQRREMYEFSCLQRLTQTHRYERWWICIRRCLWAKSTVKWFFMCFLFQIVSMCVFVCFYFIVFTRSLWHVAVNLVCLQVSVDIQPSDPQAQRPCFHQDVSMTRSCWRVDWMLIFQPAEVVIMHRAQAHPGWMAAETQNHHTDAVTAMLRHAPIQRDDSNMRSEKHHFLLPPRPSSNPTWRSTLSCSPMEAQTSDGSDKSISDMLPHISVFL